MCAVDACRKMRRPATASRPQDSVSSSQRPGALERAGLHGALPPQDRAVRTAVRVLRGAAEDTGGDDVRGVETADSPATAPGTLPRGRVMLWVLPSGVDHTPPLIRSSVQDLRQGTV